MHYNKKNDTICSNNLEWWKDQQELEKKNSGKLFWFFIGKSILVSYMFVEKIMPDSLLHLVPILLFLLKNKPK